MMNDLHTCVTYLNSGQKYIVSVSTVFSKRDWTLTSVRKKERFALADLPKLLAHFYNALKLSSTLTYTE